MEGNPNTKDAIIAQLVHEYESLSKSGNLSLLPERDFYKLIYHFEKELMLDKALELADFALERFGFTTELFLMKAQILLTLKNTSEAYEVLDLASKLSPSENEVKLLKTQCLILDKSYNEAFIILHDVMMSGELRHMLDASLLKAHIHEALKDYNAMFADIRFVLDREPGNEAAMEKLWSCMEAQRSYHQGITYLNNLLDEDPYAYLAWYNLGQAYSCIGEYENAIRAYEYSFIIQPQFEMGYKDCAELAFQMCKYKFALKVFIEALENIGPDSELFSNIGECYLKLKQYKNAQLNFRKASRLDPYNDEVYYNLGLCFAAETKYDLALHHYFKALKIEDSREEYYASIADAYFKLKDLDKANYYYIKATEIGSDLPEIWFSHVKFLNEIGEYSRALDVLNEADEFTYSAELIYAKAAVLFRLDQKDESIECLKEGLFEDFYGHSILFQFLPDLKNNAEVSSLINYYLPEE